MTDALEATRKALFDALDGELAHAVFSHVPQDQDPALGVTVIGEMTARAIFAKDDPDRQLAVTIVTIKQGESPLPVTSAQARIAELLDGASLNVTGWTISPVETSRQCRLIDDGITYVGTSIFSVMALAA